MDTTLKPISLLITQTLTLILLSLPYFINPSPLDYNILVYKQCDPYRNLVKNRNHSDSIQSHSTTLSSFFNELELKSSRSKFHKTLVGNEESAVSGSYQCRGDISDDLCHSCVKNFRDISSISCENATSARVQLQNCYMKYEIENIDTDSVGNNYYNLLETPEHGLIHKICDGGTAEAFAGFEEMRDAAFAVAAAGVVDGNGFYTANYELLHVVAQCEGDVHVCDCGDCVAIAAATAKEECRWSVSGRVYLDGCYVGYTYNPHGFPGSSHHEEGKSGNTGKTVAIVLGGAAALVLGAISLMFLKGLSDKGDDF